MPSCKIILRPLDPFRPPYGKVWLPVSWKFLVSKKFSKGPGVLKTLEGFGIPFQTSVFSVSVSERNSWEKIRGLFRNSPLPKYNLPIETMILVLDKTNPQHLNMLNDFAQQCRDISTFRYFQTRAASTVIHTHILTLLYIQDSVTKGYAHIDYNKERNQYFIGICVLPNYQNQSIGSKLLNTLLTYADNENITLHLSVDKTNKIAFALYEKIGFVRKEELPHAYMYQRLCK